MFFKKKRRLKKKEYMKDTEEIKALREYVKKAEAVNITDAQTLNITLVLAKNAIKTEKDMRVMKKNQEALYETVIGMIAALTKEGK